MSLSLSFCYTNRQFELFPMPIDKTVIETLIAAVINDPSNRALRLHLAGLLFSDENYGDALKHAQTILVEDPVDISALKIAADAAEKLGDLGKASAYRKISASLTVEAPKKVARSNDEWADVISDDPNDFENPTKNAVKDDIGNGSEFVVDIENAELKLSDVAGLEGVKRRLNVAFLSPLKNPEMMRLYGKSLRGGLLLYGPPGCGKTFIARAVAGELGAKFISVGLADVLDMWIGNSEKNVHSIFENARRNAPCVLFFDELDALGRKRSLTRNSGHGAINQLLSELDGLNQPNEGVFVLAATNHPWDVDTALRRPGRLDRTVLVLPPDSAARMGVIEYHLRHRPIDSSVDASRLASLTKEFSGADLAHLVESAAEFAMQESIDSGVVRSISHDDFKKALREVRPSTRSWFEIAKNYAQFANEGGVYDDLLEHLREIRMI